MCRCRATPTTTRGAGRASGWPADRNQANRSTPAKLGPTKGDWSPPTARSRLNVVCDARITFGSTNSSGGTVGWRSAAARSACLHHVGRHAEQNLVRMGRADCAAAHRAALIRGARAAQHGADRPLRRGRVVRCGIYAAGHDFRRRGRSATHPGPPGSHPKVPAGSRT